MKEAFAVVRKQGTYEEVQAAWKAAQSPAKDAENVDPDAAATEVTDFGNRDRESGTYECFHGTVSGGRLQDKATVTVPPEPVAIALSLTSPHVVRMPSP